MDEADLGPSDIDLVNECLSGRNEAFDLLVRRYQRPVYGLCYRMLGNADDASDAAQDCFIKAYHGLTGFRKDAVFRSWVLGIASNGCIDRIRHRTRRRVESLDQLVEETGERAAPVPTPEQEAVASDTERQVREALQALPEMQRLTFILFHFNELTIREVSEKLGRPEGTVKSDLHEVREKLRQRLRGIEQR